MQQIFTWMLNDGTVDKTVVKTFYTQALGIFRNAPVAIQPLSAVAQCKRQSALPPYPRHYAGMAH